MEKEKVLPLIAKLEKQLKYIIFYYAVMGFARNSLDYQVRLLLKKFNQELPVDIFDRSAYITGALKTAVLMINRVYVPIMFNFEKEKNNILVSTGVEVFKPETAIKYSLNQKKYQDKGMNYVSNYIKTFEKALRYISRVNVATHGKSMKPISLYQKVELDLNYQKNENLVEEARNSGKDLFWLSTHADCSIRCEKWQGKLVSLSLPAIDNSMWTGKWSRHAKIYSFTAIENIVDKYGYKNNIINGFNCRHHLIPYQFEEKAPEEYGKRDIKRERMLNDEKRRQERYIRELKNNAVLVFIYDKEGGTELNKRIESATKRYYAFCEQNDLEIEKYRLIA